MHLIQQYLLFLAAAGLVIVAPGPDNLAVLSLGVSRGRGAAVAFAVGCAAGCLTHALWAIVGVSALLAASPVGFTLFKVLGAGYLIYLGVQALRAAGRASNVGTSPGDREAPPAIDTRRDAPHVERRHEPRTDRRDARRYLARGFLANALNPKVALFFLAFLPQFVVADGPDARLQLALLGVTFAALTALAFGLLGCAAGRIGATLARRPALARRLDAGVGILFVGLGVRLLLSQPR